MDYVASMTMIPQPEIPSAVANFVVEGSVDDFLDDDDDDNDIEAVATVTKQSAIIDRDSSPSPPPVTNPAPAESPVAPKSTAQQQEEVPAWKLALVLYNID